LLYHRESYSLVWLEGVACYLCTFLKLSKGVLVTWVLDHVQPQVGKHCITNDSPGIGMVNNPLLYGGDTMKPCWIDVALAPCHDRLYAEHTVKMAKANVLIGKFYTTQGDENAD
jgi:hypothetical protein